MNPSRETEKSPWHWPFLTLGALLFEATDYPRNTLWESRLIGLLRSLGAPSHNWPAGLQDPRQGLSYRRATASQWL